MGKAMTERKSRGKPPQEAPRRRGQRAVADLLPDIGAAAFKRFGFVQSAIVSRWGEIVGPRYAEVSAPESIRFPHGRKVEGTLTLAVAGAHAPMMQHVAPAIMERVNQFFGYAAVARIVIRQAAMPAPKPRAAPSSLKPVPADLGDSLRNIADPELHAVLSALAGAVAASDGPPIVGLRLNKGSND
jgi:hypothetical protein